MWLYFDIDAQVLRPVLRQPLGHQESLCRVLHDGLKFHLSRGAALQIVPPVHQPHQWPVPLGKIHKHTRTERKITWKWKRGGDFVKITITIKCSVLSGVMKLGQLLLGAICVCVFLFLSLQFVYYLLRVFLTSSFLSLIKFEWLAQWARQISIYSTFRYDRRLSSLWGASSPPLLTHPPQAFTSERMVHY